MRPGQPEMPDRADATARSRPPARLAFRRMDRFILISVAICSLIGLLGLVLTGLLIRPMGILAAAGVLLPTLRRPGQRQREGWFRIAVPLFLFCVPFADLAFRHVNWLDILLRATVGLLLVRHWNPKAEREMMQVLAISFVHILASSAVARDLWFVFLILGFVLAGFWSLIALNCGGDLRASLRETGCPIDLSPGLRRRRFTPVEQPGFLALSGVSMVLMIALTAFFFIIIPRTGLPTYVSSQDGVDLETGFLEMVELGSVGRIKQNHTIVMRVRMPGGLGRLSVDRDLRWRALTLSDYDGVRWNQDSELPTYDLSRDGDGIIRLPRAGLLNGKIKQEILLDPIGTDYLFGLPDTVAVAPSSTDFGEVYYSIVDGTWRLSRVPLHPILYQVYSEPRRSGVHRKSFDMHAPEEPDLIRYLRIPRDMEAVRSLAESWTDGITDPEQKAIAIEKRLRTEYTYSLWIGEGEGPVSLEDFLFTVKRGHCEYYATAMVIMLRALRIPTRIVAGFLPGEWNPVGRNFIVRMSDAHAWAEAFFPGEGWVTFDPTPPGTASPLMAEGIVSWVRHCVDAFDLLWSRYVVSFRLDDQIVLFKKLRYAAARATLAGRKWSRLIRPIGTRSGIGWGIAILVVGVLAVGLAVVLGLVGRGPFGVGASLRSALSNLRRSDGGRLPSSVFAWEYLRLVRFCESHWTTRDRAETFLEFSLRLESAWPANLAGLGEATRLYYRGRFSGSTHETSNLRRLVDLSRSIRSRKRPGRNPH